MTRRASKSAGDICLSVALLSIGAAVCGCVPVDVANLSQPPYAQSGYPPGYGQPRPLQPEAAYASHPPKKRSVITGRHLGIEAGENAAERAIELKRQLAAAHERNKKLAGDVEELARNVRELTKAHARQYSNTVASVVGSYADSPQETEPHGTDEGPSDVAATANQPNQIAQASFRRHGESGESHSESFTSSANTNNGPAISGSHLGIRPGQTAAERSLELLDKLTLIQEERNSLKTQVQELERALRERDEKLLEAAGEVRKTREELAEVHSQLSQWKGDVEQLRASIRTAEQETLKTLTVIVTLLREMAGEDALPPATQNEVPGMQGMPKAPGQDSQGNGMQP